MASPVPPPPDLGISEQGAAVTGNETVGGLRSWERAWAVDEMRKEAGNWSLAADAGLLLHLQEFSQRMILKVHEIEKGVDGLLNDSKLTSVKVNNVFNDFIMLANTQFVENRVYDEDVSQEGAAKEETKPEEQEKTREQREAELIPKVKEALTLGINVIDEAFEKLDSHVADSDSEDDDETGYRVDPILEPKDPYLSRPLPLLIGTPNFLNDDNVGLLEEESEEEESDHGSISESESEDEKKQETSDESGDSDDDLFGGKGKDSDDQEDDETDDEDEDEIAREKETQPKGPTDFASELAKKIGVPAKKPPPESDEDGDDEFVDDPKPKTKGKEKKRTDSESSHKKSKKGKDKSSSKTKVPDDDVDLFGAPEEEDSPFGTSGGLFSASKSMFDDDSDEGGLFGDVVTEEAIEEEKPKKKTSKKPAGGVSLFRADDDDMFESSTKERSDSNKKPTSISAPSTKKGGGAGSGFFDDDDDEDEDAGDLFATSNKKPSGEEKVKAPSKSALFDDEDDEGDLFGSGSAAKPPEEKKKPEKKLPAGAVSMFGSGPNPLAAALKKQRPASDDEDSDASAGHKSRSSSIKSSQSQSSLSSRQVDKVKKDGRSSSNNSLFDEDADDSLFSSPPKPRADSKSKAKPVDSLFGEDEDDGLFGMGKKPNKKAAAKSKVTEKPKSSGLFGEEDEEGDMFDGAPVKSTPSKKPVGGVSLFGGADILGKKKADPTPEPVQKQEPPKTQAAAPNKSPLSLFDDNADEEDDLFGGVGDVATKAPQAKPVATTGGKRDLFGDEDVLFGGAEEESPGVNLFGSPASPGTSPEKSSPVKSKAAPTPKAPVTKVTQKSSSGLFNDDDDDDMFGSSAPKVRADSGATLPVAGVTTEESSDTPKNKEATKPWKPVGGVSIMGGIDPFAIKKRRPVGESDEEDDVGPKKTEVKEPPEPAQSAPVTKKVDPLFGDDDDSDDMFTVSKPSPKPSTISATKPPQKTEDVFSPNKPANTSVPKPKPGPLSVDDDEDDDDMFGRKPPPLQLDSPAKSKVGDVFSSSPSSESDMFGSSPPALEEPQTAPPKVKKPPAGAVSMFGGVDPFAAMKKKQAVESEKTAEDSEEQPSASVPKKATSNKGSELPSPTKETEPPSPTKGFAPSSPTKGPEKGFPTKGPAGKIGKLKMNIGINPAALLPGAAPPVKEPEPVAIGFDQPAEVKTLHSASKDRARIQTKRRPPSRMARQSKGDSSTSDLFSPSSPPGDDVPKEMPKPVVNNRVPQPTSDLFGNDDLLDGGSTTPVKSAPIVQENHLFSGGAFSSGAKVTKSKKGVDDDLFGSPTKSVVKSATSDDVFDVSSKKPSTLMNNDEEEDLFAPKSSKRSTKVTDEDDIFSTSQPKVSKQLLNDDNLFPSKSGTKNDNSKALPPSEKSTNGTQNDDDIFGGVGTPKKTEAKPVLEKDKMNNDDIFAGATDTVKKVEKPNQDEDEDLFGKPMEKKKRQVKRAPKTKDEDLFNDNTDIFADVPASKPKEKKKKKTTTGGSKSLFKDTDGLDDIFASAPPKTKTTKKEKAKKTAPAAEKKTGADSNDIFDDPLGN
ncbi:WASH complex subunit 2A-like isoform X2 [Mizuhopecten yessoensis]|uniref:WASH complex subunit FAM21 n=1 Tax=Mizuhopecten yessoensis TaxID=6573 RepID=A0A210Q7F6_MIZYE|nr:WASH complex subunit 2A-like isoform X2 [Mizuhopecten yessoensis]OWF44676.1 WASH complex subunit FAM21 [Mizuhopecten yessoensis]